MYAAATYMLYREVHVNGETVEPVQRLFEKQTAGQAVPCFVVSKALLNCTYDSAIGKKVLKKLPCIQCRHTLFVSDPT
jgi:hypothetical protein